MDHEDEHGRVELEDGALGQSAEGNVLQDPALADPVRHDGVDAKRSGDWCALKVLALASGVLGQCRHGDVEAGETRQAAKNEKGQADSVGDGTHADAEGHHGRGNAERNLPPHIS